MLFDDARQILQLRLISGTLTMFDPKLGAAPTHCARFRAWLRAIMAKIVGELARRPGPRPRKLTEQQRARGRITPAPVRLVSVSEADQQAEDARIEESLIWALLDRSFEIALPRIRRELAGLGRPTDWERELAMVALDLRSPRAVADTHGIKEDSIRHDVDRYLKKFLLPVLRRLIGQELCLSCNLEVDDRNERIDAEIRRLLGRLPISTQGSLDDA